MESSIEKNSVSTDIAAAADKTDTRKCEHFSIRGFVAEVRKKDPRKCWPFSADTVDAGDHQSYALPPLTVPKSRWWHCASCIKDINKDCDCQLQSHSRSNTEENLDTDLSSAIASIKRLDLMIANAKKERKNDETDCHSRSNTEKKLDADHSSAIASKGRLNSMTVNDKNEEKNDETATTIFLKEVRRRANDGSTVKSKSPEQVSKRCREKANVSTDIAGVVVDDTPNKAIKKKNHRKSGKVRLLSDLVDNRNIETLSETELVRGRKRKSCGDEETTNYGSRMLNTIGEDSENVSKSSCVSEDNTDSGFDKGPIKFATPDHSSFSGKELVSCSLHKERREKEPSLVKKRNGKAVMEKKPDDLPQASPRNTMPQPTRDFLNSKWLDSSFEKLSVSDDRPPVFPLPCQERNDDRGFMKDARKNQFRDVASGVNVDISLGKGKGKEVAVEEHIDDSPMEIVELLAKNQYERCLPDREEDKQPSQATTSVSKNPLLIDLNETYDNSMDNNTLRQPKPHGKDAATQEGHFMTGMQFSPASRLGQPYNVPSDSIQFSGVVGPNQHSRQNCQWLGNVPTTMANHQYPSPSPFRVLRPCDMYQSVQQPQYREASHPIWPSSMTSSHAHQQAPLNMPHQFMEPNTRNLNFPDNGKHQHGFEGVSSKPLDTAYESSIPAMKLLSLMDPQLRSNIPIDQSQNTRFVETPFAPVHRSKVIVGPPQAYSTMHRPFDYSKRVATPETSRENSSIIPLSYHPLLFTRKSTDPRKFQLLGASDSMKLPLKLLMKDKKKPEGYKAGAASTRPSQSTCGPVVCNVNRNPADFTIPDSPGNIYMIKGEDLKRGFRKKPSLCKQDASKQNKKPVPPPAENS